MQLGLFNHIYLRVLGLIIFVILAMLLFNHIHSQQALLQAWQQDLQQEAEWTARHWSTGQAAQPFANAWHLTHDGVRLQITDVNGNLVADSEQLVPPHLESFVPERNALVGRAAFQSAGGAGELILSRNDLNQFGRSISVGLLITGTILALVTAGVIYPFVRAMTNSLTSLAGLASRVAQGHFGETLTEKGGKDISALIASFNEMSLRLKTAEQQNERLMSDVSHELRSPLARLTALIDTIQRHPDEVGELSAQIKNEVSLMGRLIDDVLESSRFDTPEPQLDKSIVDVDEWLVDAMAQFRPRVESAGISLSQSDGAAHAYVLLDRQRMMQVLGNVIDNAIKGVAAAVSPRIELKVVTNDNQWKLQVIDNGIGIPESDVPFVFDRFYRVDTGRERQTGGAGLGLSISRAIVQAHGGTISIATAAGPGTAVEICLPTAQEI